MVTSLYCLLVIMAFAVPSECIKRKESRGGRQHRPEHEVPPRVPTQQFFQHPPGNGLPRLQGPQARPPPDPRLRAEAAPFTPQAPQTRLPTGSGPYHPQGTMQHGPRGPRPDRGQSYQPHFPVWQPEKKNICPLMCARGLKPGDACGPNPGCICAIDLKQHSLTNLPCIFMSVKNFFGPGAGKSATTARM
uniref:Putative secreted protein n=1 Tax=Amblyomma triste TaxID=251400 RepID=A0A023G5C0_AMBTT